MNRNQTYRRLGLEIFLFFLLLYALTANGRLVNRDGEAVFQVARSIAERGWFDVPAESVFEESAGPRGTEGDSLSFATETARRGPDGRLYAMYGLGQSLASLPFYFVGKLLAAVIPAVSPYFVTRFAVAFLDPVVSALTCAVLFAYARSLGLAPRVSLLLSLIYGLATMAWPYAKSYAGEPLAGLMLLLAAFCLSRSRADGGPALWSVLAGAALGFAVMVRVSTGVLLPVFAIYGLAMALERRREEGKREKGTRGERSTLVLPRRTRLSTLLIAFGFPIAVLLALIAWYNYLRFGSPWVTGYQSIAWNRPLLEGLYGLLLSPGKGLLWYNPVLILAPVAFAGFFRARRREALFFAGLALVWLGFHAPYRFWEGGWSWGPRLMLPVLPFLVLPVGVLDSFRGLSGRFGSRLLPLAVALGLAVQISAVSVDYTRYLWRTYSNSLDDAYLSKLHLGGMAGTNVFESPYVRVVHRPASSPLVKQWGELAAVLSNAVRPGELVKARAEIAEKEAKWRTDGMPETEVSVAVQTETQVAGLNFPDFWFVYLYLFGAPALVVAAAVLPLLTGFGALLFVLDRRLRALQAEKGWAN